MMTIVNKALVADGKLKLTTLLLALKQVSPVLRNLATIIPATAASMSVSSSTVYTRVPKDSLDFASALRPNCQIVRNASSCGKR
jgi:hypothetical protein